MRRRFLLLLMVAWGLALVLVVGGTMFLAVGGDSSCLHPTADSSFGDASWSWVPLGVECTWTEEQHGLDDQHDPGWLLTIVVAGTVVAGFALHRLDEDLRAKLEASKSAAPASETD